MEVLRNGMGKEIIMYMKEVASMQNINITSARSELFKLASSCIKYNNVININTKEGNVIMLSEEDYNSLLESLYLAGYLGCIRVL